MTTRCAKTNEARPIRLRGAVSHSLTGCLHRVQSRRRRMNRPPAVHHEGLSRDVRVLDEEEQGAGHVYGATGPARRGNAAPARTVGWGGVGVGLVVGGG